MHKFAQKSKQLEKISTKKKSSSGSCSICTNLHKIHEPWEDEDDESDKHIKARVLEVTRA